MLTTVLHHEKRVQINDKTRFVATESFAVKGSSALTSVLIKPGADQTPINVFASDNRQWYLDYAFTEFKADLDTSNNFLKIEHNGVPVTLTLAVGTYDLPTLVATLEAQLQILIAGATIEINEANELDFITPEPIKIYSKGLAKWLGIPHDTQLAKHIETWPVEVLPRLVTLSISNGVETKAQDYRLDIASVEGDSLFSTDGDLLAEESEILSWVTKGRASFIDVHRKAQDKILEWLDKNGYRMDPYSKPGMSNGELKKINKWAIVDNSDLKQWSTYTALRMIFSGIQNAKDDFFKDKAKHYEVYEIEARNRAVVTLDLDGDKSADNGSTGPNVSSGTLWRR